MIYYSTGFAKRNCIAQLYSVLRQGKNAKTLTELRQPSQKAETKLVIDQEEMYYSSIYLKLQPCKCAKLT